MVKKAIGLSRHTFPKHSQWVVRDIQNGKQKLDGGLLMKSEWTWMQEAFFPRMTAEDSALAFVLWIKETHPHYYHRLLGAYMGRGGKNEQ